jgi:C4-dicarboxylate-specific signal transduction histidine kinase
MRIDAKVSQLFHFCFISFNRILVAPSDLGTDKSSEVAMSKIRCLDSNEMSSNETTAVTASEFQLMIEENKKLKQLLQIKTHELDTQKSALVQMAKLANLGKMSASIAHEINTPLAAIQLISSQIQTDGELGRLKPQEWVQLAVQIEEMVMRIGKIIQSVRSFSRDAKMDPMQKACVRELINGSVAFCEREFRYANIRLEVEEVSEDLHVECHAVQIQQVLLNLLNNSFDAIRGHQGDKWVRIRVDKEEDCVRISVRDSGAGIPAGIRHKILEPFFTTKGVGKGTGLGLSVCADIVEQHNGIFVLDETDTHTHFQILLPILQRDPQWDFQEIIHAS